MKPFATYHHLPDYPMTERDKKQIGSKFWGRGKWDNFVVPHLPKSGKDLTLIDMGCNAGLFLKFAEEMGFSRIIGVDSDSEAVTRGRAWCVKNNSKYTFIQKDIKNVVEELPIADYTILSNLHYYFTINDWVEYLDKIKNKTRYIIIVTAEKKHINRCWASADVASIRNYFKDWKEVGFVNELPLEGDPDPRRLWSLCFESPVIEKAPMDSLDSSNHVQDDFYAQLDEGRHYKNTQYYKIYKRYREKKWGEERLNTWFEERVKNYNDLKAQGQRTPILVNFFDPKMILDGNHRYAMMRHLQNPEVFIRKT